MDVTNEFLEVDIFLAHDGFVTVLEELAVPPIESIETARIARKQAGHHGAKRHRAGPQEEMYVIG